MSKTVPLSVRISEADAAFIARLSMPDAVTPSEKIRGLIAEARQRHQAASSPREGVAFLRGTLEPQRQRIRALEEKLGTHSEVVARIGEWLPEFLAHFLGAPLSKDEESEEALRVLERSLVVKLLSLMEGVLRLAVTSREPCYDPRVISSHLEVVTELVKMIERCRKDDAQR